MGENWGSRLANDVFIVIYLAQLPFIYNCTHIDWHNKLYVINYMETISRDINVSVFRCLVNIQSS